MRMLSVVAAAGLAVAVLFAGGAGPAAFSTSPAFAQATPEKAAPKQTRKARSDQRKARRAAARSKRAACQAEARSRKLGMIQRQRFLRTCLRG
jgi:hypothetical protein